MHHIFILTKLKVDISDLSVPKHVHYVHNNLENQSRLECLVDARLLLNEVPVTFGHNDKVTIITEATPHSVMALLTITFAFEAYGITPDIQIIRNRLGEREFLMGGDYTSEGIDWAQTQYQKNVEFSNLEKLKTND